MIFFNIMWYCSYLILIFSMHDDNFTHISSMICLNNGSKSMVRCVLLSSLWIGRIGDVPNLVAVTKVACLMDSLPFLSKLDLDETLSNEWIPQCHGGLCLWISSHQDCEGGGLGLY